MKKLEIKIDCKIEPLGLRGIYLVCRGLLNSLDQEIIEKDAILDNVVFQNKSHVIEDPIISGFRELHTKIEVSNRKFVSSPENLILNFINRREFHEINTIVDLYNLISIKYKLAIGAHDMSNIDGDVNLRMTIGNERFVPLGQTEPKSVRENIYSYIDDSNEIICLLEVRQVEKTKVTEKTKDCFFIVQGNSSTSIEYIRTATSELISLLNKYCGGNTEILKEVF